MEPGLYDHLLTKAIESEIAKLGDPRLAMLAPVDSEESHSVIAQYLERVIASSLAHYRGSDASTMQRDLVDRILAAIVGSISDPQVPDYSIASPLQRLLAIQQNPNDSRVDRPDSPLSRSSLFTGTRLACQSARVIVSRHNIQPEPDVAATLVR